LRRTLVNRQRTMASSRWKRFAFFDRKNLPLPPAVTKDLVPSNDIGGNHQRQRQRQSRQQQGSTNYTDNEALDPRFLYPEESSSDDCTKIGHGEYFSLVAAENVSLPSSLFGGGSDGAIKRGAGGDGAPAMQAGLMAMKSSTSRSNGKTFSRGNLQNSASFETSTTSSTTKLGNNEGGGGELLLLFASSRNTPLVHCIDVTVRCTPQNPHSIRESEENGTAGAASSSVAGSTSGRDAFASNSSNAGNNDASNPEDLDGWRGHYNPFLAADGFISASSATNESNPLPSGGKNGPSNTTTTTASSSGSKSTKTSVGTARGRSTAEKRILEEHLSGSANDYDTGGSLFASSPFASPSMDATSSVDASVQKARIVGLATCGLIPSSLGKKQPQPQQSQSRANANSSVLYVASITDASNTVGLVVHANPHLILSTQLSSSTLSSSSSQAQPRSMHSHYYKPNGQFNFLNHGKPTCVTILPGVVGVGTDTGMILIYVFDYLITPSNDRGGRLTLVAEIPAPRGGSTVTDGQKGNDKVTPYSVSSLELISPSPLSSDGSITGKAAGSSATATTQQKQPHGMHRLFVSYRRRTAQSDGFGTNKSGENATSPSKLSQSSASGPSGGVCCYELGGLRIPGKPIPPGLSANAPVVSARYDMDGRDVGTSCLCDAVSLPPMPPSLWFSNGDSTVKESGSGIDRKKGDGTTAQGEASTAVNDVEKILPRYLVARGDGLHFYSPSEKVGVCPVDGNKISMCSLPPPPAVYLKRPLRPTTSGTVGSSSSLISGAGASYALVATTDSKSGRDAVDIYDTTNKIVGFHVLLSPGHRALRAVGVASSPAVDGRNLIRGGRSSAIVMTSGGSIVTLTEKVTPDKVALLVQKNLYSAAISIAFSDPAFYRPEDITALYRRYAEHLYRKGDFAAAMDQYILTIGSLESSHVIFRYLDAPKIPLLVKYLEALRAQGLASSVHNELLRTCYLKLNDPESAGKIILTASSNRDEATPLLRDSSGSHTISISRNLLACADNPSEMLAAICSFEAPETVQALVAHGPILARSLPRETAGVVIALCDGTYSPTALADAAAGRPATKEDGDNAPACEKYPISLFANSFIENPKLLRLILSHCRRNECVLTPMLRRTLLELTVDEWNAAKRTGDNDLEKLRYDEAITLLSENHVEDMGDYEALVIVEAAGFTDGEILLYERLNMVPMLLEEYARNGGERARRQMLAMCEHDPELFSEVLSHFVSIAAEKSNKGANQEDGSINSETEIGGVFRDIHEALVMAREHGNLPPVRILRILAGEGFGQFSSDNHPSHLQTQCSVPLSVALDYVGAILDDSSRKINRLKSNVEEYNKSCNDMEHEIEALLSSGTSKSNSTEFKSCLPNVDIDEMYSTLQDMAEGKQNQSLAADTGGFGRQGSEEFWREMENSYDPFETICFYISKGYLENI